MNTRVSGRAATLAGLALIVFPLLGVMAKLVFPGWVLVVAIWSSWFLLPGYVVQVVVAASALLRRSGVLRHAAGAWRALVAAWTTSIGVLGVGFFLIDGGDDGVTESAMTVLFGLAGSDAAGALSSRLAEISAFLWIFGWLWLVAEWIIQLLLARRARGRR